MDKKVIFILGYLNSQNADKRIKEFLSRGVEVEVYGFLRNDSNAEIRIKDYTIIGEFPTSMGYRKRIPVLFKGIRSVIEAHKGENVLFYVFGLDVSTIFRLQCKKPFIYEEEDLIYTYIKYKFVVNVLKRIDRSIVNKSLLTVFTSEGFSEFHFGSEMPEKVVIIPNKLKKEVLDYKPIEKSLDLNKLRIGFVGSFRFQSVFNFAKVFTELYPNHEFHFFGGTSNVEDALLFKQLESIPNCFFHGRFQNPDDLPEVYSQIDLLLSTYDVKYDNVKYAEPNKIYEAIYFETPIIATKGTFLAQKISQLGIGYELDPLDRLSIEEFVSNLTEQSYYNVVDNIRKLPKQYTIDNYDCLFKKSLYTHN